MLHVIKDFIKQQTIFSYKIEISPFVSTLWLLLCIIFCNNILITKILILIAIPSDATDSRRELVLSQSPTKALCPSLRCNHSSTTDNVELSRSKRGIGSLICKYVITLISWWRGRCGSHPANISVKFDMNQPQSYEMINHIIIVTVLLNEWSYTPCTFSIWF